LLRGLGHCDSFDYLCLLSGFRWRYEIKLALDMLLAESLSDVCRCVSGDKDLDLGDAAEDPISQEDAGAR